MDDDVEVDSGGEEWVESSPLDLGQIRGQPIINGPAVKLERFPRFLTKLEAICDY